MKKIRVGVIFGGRSGEHEISLRSAESVLRSLDPNKYEVVPIGITHEGKWLSSRKSASLLPPKEMMSVSSRPARAGWRELGVPGMGLALNLGPSNWD